MKNLLKNVLIIIFVTFLKLHGYRGEKLIERLGLGIDGYADERLAKQQARDAGKLGGVIYQKKYYTNIH